jgi:hypothetical protein
MISVVPCKVVEVMTLFDLQASGFRPTVAYNPDTNSTDKVSRYALNRIHFVPASAENGQSGPKRECNRNLL